VGMKFLLTLVLSVMSLTVFASQTFDCDFIGPNYKLSFQKNGSITLANKFKIFECKKGYVYFPGTEIELSVLNCLSGREKVMFYANENADGDIILGRDIIFSKDILCNKESF
jgi:hypothetical protein